MKYLSGFTARRLYVTRISGSFKMSGSSSANIFSEIGEGSIILGVVEEGLKNELIFDCILFQFFLLFFPLCSFFPNCPIPLATELLRTQVEQSGIWNLGILNLDLF